MFLFKLIFVMIFFFILLVLLMGFSMLRAFKRFFLGDSRPDAKKESRQQRDPYSSAGSRQYTGASTNTPAKKKIFDDDEGEYVDFEEVK